MNQVRIATYAVTGGTAADIVELVQSPGGMLDIYRSTPGFNGYLFLETAPNEFTVVLGWETQEQAEASVDAAAEWVAAHVAERISLTHHTGATPLLSVGSFR